MNLFLDTSLAIHRAKLHMYSVEIGKAVVDGHWLALADSAERSSPLANRLRNNYRHLRKWGRREGIDAFRLYDRDIKEYPLAIDYYGGRFCLHHYEDASSERDEEALILAVEEALQLAFDPGPLQLYWRHRFRRGRLVQYERRGEGADEFFTVQEHGLQFWVNLTNYLDTGLFLDHRRTRQLVARAAAGKRVLNLFAYTCAFSVHAAAAGAAETVSVDLSNTYLSWGRGNFELNGLGEENNRLVRADCLGYLERAIRRKERYDMIVMDPPTLSRSKKMTGLFDLQRQHSAVIQQALQLLDGGGHLFFSTNARRFAFDATGLPDSIEAKEISGQTLPPDFRDRRIHRCWQIRYRP